MRVSPERGKARQSFDPKEGASLSGFVARGLHFGTVDAQLGSEGASHVRECRGQLQGLCGIEHLRLLGTIFVPVAHLRREWAGLWTVSKEKLCTCPESARVLQQEVCRDFVKCNPQSHHHAHTSHPVERCGRTGIRCETC